MRRLIRYLGEVWAWFWKTKLLLQSLFIVACALLFSYFTGPTETSVENGGYILQILGMMMAIAGLLKVREHFGHPPLVDLARQWRRDFPKWRKNHVIDAGTGNLSVVGMKAYIEVWAPDKPDQPLEKRVEAILKNLERLREFQQTSTQRVDDLEEKNEERHKQHKAALDRVADALQTDLEALHTDDILPSLIGLAWVAIGIAISAWPGIVIGILI